MQDNSWFGQLERPHPKDADAETLALMQVPTYRKAVCDRIRRDPILWLLLENTEGDLKAKYEAHGVSWTSLNEYLERMEHTARGKMLA